jgi:hypothetical protein
MGNAYMNSIALTKAELHLEALLDHTKEPPCFAASHTRRIVARGTKCIRHKLGASCPSPHGFRRGRQDKNKEPVPFRWRRLLLYRFVG